ncbi:hypothetical protein QWZ14_02895, partial [Paeniroseomonas aquatica]
RAALVALDREQLRFTAAGMVVETAQGALELARAPDSDRCPVRALEAWLRQARIDYVWSRDEVVRVNLES